MNKPEDKDYNGVWIDAKPDWEKEFGEKIRPIIYERPPTAEHAADNASKIKSFISSLLASQKEEDMLRIVAAETLNKDLAEKLKQEWIERGENLFLPIHKVAHQDTCIECMEARAYNAAIFDFIGKIKEV